MNKDELNDREYIVGKKNYYWQAIDEHCSIDETMNKDELNEGECIQGRKNYFWHVIDYYSGSDNTMNKDELNERKNILGKKNHYWHATNDQCRPHCNSKSDVNPFVIGETQVNLQEEELVPLESNTGDSKNFQKILELSTGEYVNLHGDCDVMFLPGTSNGVNVKRDSKNINDKEKFLYSNLKHMYTQLVMLRNNSNYSVLNGPEARVDCTSTLFSGYNAVEIIMKNYMDILYSFEGNGLTSSDIKYQKHFLLFIILPFIRGVINSNMPFNSDRIVGLFTEYYCDEIYFEEKLAELKSILVLKR